MENTKYTKAIELIKNKLKEIQGSFPDYSFIYGINYLSDMHIIKIDNYAQINNNSEYKEMEYSLFDMFYEEIEGEDIIFADTLNKYLNLDINFNDLELNIPYSNNSTKSNTVEVEEYVQNETTDLLNYALAA